MDKECTTGVSGTIEPKKRKRRKKEGPTLQAQFEVAMMKMVCIPEARLLQELEGFRAEKKYKPQWVTANYVSIVDKFPPKGDIDAAEPSEAMREWFKLKSKLHFIVQSRNKVVAQQIIAWNEV